MKSERKGFGEVPPPARPPSKGQKRRNAAASRYDEMATAGIPEYTVWMRLKEGGTQDNQEQMPWLLVGCISVPRSSQIADALFDVEDDFMQGAVHLFPQLQKEDRGNIEFGYQLRQLDDEEVCVANRPNVYGRQGTLRKWLRQLQNLMNDV